MEFWRIVVGSQVLEDEVSRASRLGSWALLLGIHTILVVHLGPKRALPQARRKGFYCLPCT